MRQVTIAALLVFVCALAPAGAQTTFTEIVKYNQLTGPVPHSSCHPDNNPINGYGCCGSPGVAGCVLQNTCVGPSSNVLRIDPFSHLVNCNIPDPPADTNIGATLGGKNDVTFYFTSDLHMFRGGNATSFNAPALTRHVQVMNSWAGRAWPASIGIPASETVPTPRGVVIGGDFTLSASSGELGAYRMLYEKGTIGDSINFPVFVGLGNHEILNNVDSDSAADRAWSYVANRMTALSPDANLTTMKGSMNYSWDWGKAHLVQLNTWAADNCGRVDRASGGPRTSGLQWLASDLATRVGYSGRPVIVFQHYGLDVVDKNSDNPKAGCGKDWSMQDFTDFWNVIRDYNVIGMFSGHTHEPFVFSPSNCGFGQCAASFPATTDSKGRTKILDDFNSGTGGENHSKPDSAKTNPEDNRGEFLVTRLTDKYMDVATVGWKGTAAPDYFNTPASGTYWYRGGYSGCRKRINTRFVPIRSLFSLTGSNPSSVRKTSGPALTGEIAVTVSSQAPHDFVDSCAEGEAYRLLTASEIATLNSGGSVNFTDLVGTDYIWALPPTKGVDPEFIDLQGTVANPPGPQTVTFYGPPNTAFTVAPNFQTNEGAWIVLDNPPATFDMFGKAAVNFHLDPTRFNTFNRATTASIKLNTADPADFVFTLVSINVKEPVTVTLFADPQTSWQPGTTPPLFTANFIARHYSDQIGNTYKPTGNAGLYRILSDGSLSLISVAQVNAGSCRTNSDRNTFLPDQIIYGSPWTGGACPTQVDKTSNSNIFQFGTNPPLSAGQHRLMVRYNFDNIDPFYSQADSPVMDYYIGPAPGATVAQSPLQQTAIVGQHFFLPGIVQITNGSGTGIPDVPVTFTLSNGPTGTAAGGVFTTTLTQQAIVYTNSTGSASAPPVMTNRRAGSYDMSAGALWAGAFVHFTLTNLPGPAALLGLVNDNQTATVGQAFAGPLKVLLGDQYGNPISGAGVSFSPPASGATAALSSLSVTTDANGAAAVGATAMGLAGTYSVSVSAAGLTGGFTLTNLVPAPAALQILNGAGQTVPIGQTFPQLAVRAVNAQGAAMPGVPIAFSAPATGASATFSGPNPVLTDGNGVAVMSAVANLTVGMYTVTVSSGGTVNTFPLTNAPGAPASITALGGGGQTATVATPFPQQLRVQVKDAYGNVTPGVTVAFVGPSSGPSVMGVSLLAQTDPSGIAFMNETAGLVAGAYTVLANCGTAPPASFPMTNRADVPQTVQATSGAGQSAQAGAAFASPLQVTVKDRYSNPVSGATVQFNAAATGASATFTTPSATTDANGVAATPVRANTVAGAHTVTATANGIAANFPLINTAGPPASIAASGGASQSAQILQSFPTPLLALVKDQYGNPVAGVTVAFAAPPLSGASAQLSLLNSQTDPAGVARAAATANNVAGGPYNVTASVGAIGGATYSLTNRPGPPNSITPVSGISQSAVVTSAFAPLKVVVKDVGGNLLENVAVTFSAPAAGASATLGSGGAATTDAAGSAAVTATANTVSGIYGVNAVVAASGIAPASFALTNLAGPPANLTVTGTLQLALSGAAFPAPLTARVTDQYDNPVPNRPVLFAAPAAGVSALFGAAGNSATLPTGAAGVATTPAVIANAIGGTYFVAVTVPNTSLSASLMLTNIGPIPTLPSSPTVQQIVNTTAVTVSYASVASAGGTTIAPVNPAGGSPIPSQYALDGSSVGFDIATSAGYTAPVTVCFAMNGVNDPAAFNALRVLHFTSGAWADETVLTGPNAPSFASRTLCAQSASLSPFVVAKAVGPIARLSSKALSFGSLNLRSTGSLTLTVTNTGIAPLIVTGVALAGANAGDFAQTNNCSTVAPLASCAVTVAFTPAALGARTASLTLTDNDGAVAGSQQTVPLSGAGLLRYALYATGNVCQTLNLTGNLYTDSYDSTVGPYAQSKSAAQGDVALNGNAALAANVVVNGALYATDPRVVTAACAAGAPAGGVNLSGKAAATGGYKPLGSAVPFTAPAPAVAGSTDVSLSKDGSLAPGAYRDVSLQSSAILTLSPGVYRFNSLKVSAQSQIRIASGGPVTVNLVGASGVTPLALSGGSVNGGGYSGNLTLVYAGSAALDLSGGSAVSAILYAPDASVTIGGKTEWSGAMVAKTIAGSGNGVVHYDRSLGR